jgi:hypothetical protein
MGYRYVASTELAQNGVRRAVVPRIPIGSRRTLCASTAALACMGLVMWLTPAAAQSPAAKPSTGGKSWTTPRTPDGKPDLQGIWTDGTVTSSRCQSGLIFQNLYTCVRPMERRRKLTQQRVESLSKVVGSPGIKHRIRLKTDRTLKPRLMGIE